MAGRRTEELHEKGGGKKEKGEKKKNRDECLCTTHVNI